MAIVVSHVGSDFDALCAQALRQAPLADLIELRLDRIGDPGEERLAGFVQASPKAVIVSVHGPDGHGTFEGGPDELLAILRTAARAGASFVDVDWRLSLELGEVEGKCHRIVSRHDKVGTPEDLQGLHDEVRDVLYEGDLIKLVTHAESTEDGLRMLELVRGVGGGLIGFCSGPRGGFTRVLAPIYGSPFTYAAPAGLPDQPAPEATAPGQIRVNDLRGRMPPGGVSVETAIFGVAGRPVGHSWSPHVHGMALKGARLDAVYVAFEPRTLPGLVELLAYGNVRGLSVAAPFKEQARGLAHTLDADSQATGACNTLVRDPEGWQGRNTDVPALADTFAGALKLHGHKRQRAVVPEGQRVLVLGAGGAARAAVVGVQRQGARATVAARRPEQAEALAKDLGCAAIPWEAIPACEHDVLIHTTPVGSAAHAAQAGEAVDGDDGHLPIPVEWIRPATLVIDAVYRPIKTPLLAAALAKGCTAVPGGEWFVRQAGAQFRIFTQHEPDDALLKAAFDNAYREDQRAK